MNSRIDREPTDEELLTQEWEERLKSEGLGRIGRGPNPYQSGTTGHDKVTRDAKTQYYQTLGAKAASEPFPNDVERTVMTMYAEGASLVNIAKHLKTLNLGRQAKTVGKIVGRYERKWGIVTRG